jgi:formylglycine-generating enzyme required for sulfatase activity
MKLGEAASHSSTRGSDDPKSCVNVVGQRMIVLRPPETTLMGSPFWESGRSSSEQLNWIRIPRDFALAETETTVTQFRSFLESPRTQRYYDRIGKTFSFTEKLAPHDECPQISVRWFDAARFCQWLSEEEGVSEDQWCYPRIWDDEEEFEMPADVLERTGYRLPTEAEWEYACRAGSRVSRPYGVSDSLLGAYEWYVANAEGRGRSVGDRKPNRWGFFDMLGNVSEWCQGRYAPYRTPAHDFARRDVEDFLTVLPQSYRVVRGVVTDFVAHGFPGRFRGDVQTSISHVQSSCARGVVQKGALARSRIVQATALEECHRKKTPELPCP